MAAITTWLLFLSTIYVIVAGKPDIWGPGLQPDIVVLPAYYFFIRLEGSTEDLKEPIIQVTVQSLEPNSRCRLRTHILKKEPGFYIVRYKVYFECSNVVINILKNGSPLQEAIYVNGTVYPHYCNCPKKSPEVWMSDNDCSSQTPKQMEKDLQAYSSGVNFAQGLKKAENRFHNAGAYAWCHYVIKDGEIYRRCYGEHVGFSMFWDSVLTQILRTTNLPDLQFLANLGDWPLIDKKFDDIPMFSWCGSTQTKDIIFPTYDLTESSLEMLGRQSLDVLSSMGTNAPRWEDKIDKLFWKGRDSRRERLNLVKMSQKYPDLINASITNWFFFRKEMDKYGGSTKSVPFYDFFNYKYQLNVDGTVAAYRFPYLVAGNSVVLKQESQYFEHFYCDLVPWIHYVPVNHDLSNLVDRIKWAQSHEQQVKQIVRNGQDYVLKNLLPHNVLCYHVKLLTKWSTLLKDEVFVRDGMIKVDKVKKEFPKCSCNTRNAQRDEL